MLGDLRKRDCFHTSHIDIVLQQLQAQRSKKGRPIPDDMKKAMNYCRRFKPLKNDTNTTKAKDNLLRLVQDQHGRYFSRCLDFEAAQLLNLMPGTVEEARKLIPTLDKNPHLDALLKELQPMRDYDRSIQ
eukprot:gb/GFBE01047820.1/.p1 GENE.gb/GFBE01047820.1/~~gb/GFBE01047820.1/.p1  ORF type:complete len:130 (+),score=21.90 gb/GFBE01047820.1/:1-390(+)